MADYAVEVTHAANWFGEQLFDPNEQRSIFVDRLRELLMARYEEHWYPEEPHRGCAYRALMSTVNQIDPLLLRAAESTGQRGLFESFNRVFADVGEVNCWINPGEVKVLRGRAQSVLYSDGSGSDNPYEKLRIKIEPTRLAVKVDPVEHIPTSPVSSHNGSQSGMGGDISFSAFARGPANSHAGSSQGCSESQSPAESPMPSWSRTGNNGLPAMAPLPPHMNAGANGSFGGGNGGSFGGGVFGHGFGNDGNASFSQGLDGSGMSTLGGLGSMGGGMGGFAGANGLLPQQQQQNANQQQHSSPMRPGYYGGSNSFGSTPVF